MLLNLYTMVSIQNELELKELILKLKQLLQIGTKIYLTFLPRSSTVNFVDSLEINDYNIDHVEEMLKQYYKHVNILVHVFV